MLSLEVEKRVQKSSKLVNEEAGEENLTRCCYVLVAETCLWRSASLSRFHPPIHLPFYNLEIAAKQ